MEKGKAVEAKTLKAIIQCLGSEDAPAKLSVLAHLEQCAAADPGELLPLLLKGGVLSAVIQRAMDDTEQVELAAVKALLIMCSWHEGEPHYVCYYVVFVNAPLRCELMVCLL